MFLRFDFVSDWVLCIHASLSPLCMATARDTGALSALWWLGPPPAIVSDAAQKDERKRPERMRSNVSIRKVEFP